MSLPKIRRYENVWKFSVGLALLTSIATRGARFSSVVAGLVTPTFRPKHPPAPGPAASGGAAVGESLGKISAPAGVAPPVVLLNGASAISPRTPLWRSCVMVAYWRH